MDTEKDKDSRGVRNSLRDVLPAVTILLGGVPLLTVLVLTALNFIRSSRL